MRKVGYAWLSSAYLPACQNARGEGKAGGGWRCRLGARRGDPLCHGMTRFRSGQVGALQRWSGCCTSTLGNGHAPACCHIAIVSPGYGPTLAGRDPHGNLGDAPTNSLRRCFGRVAFGRYDPRHLPLVFPDRQCLDPRSRVVAVAPAEAKRCLLDCHRHANGRDRAVARRRPGGALERLAGSPLAVLDLPRTGGPHVLACECAFGGKHPLAGGALPVRRCTWIGRSVRADQHRAAPDPPAGVRVLQSWARAALALLLRLRAARAVRRCRRISGGLAQSALFHGRRAARAVLLGAGIALSGTTWWRAGPAAILVGLMVFATASELGHPVEEREDLITGGAGLDRNCRWTKKYL